MIDDEWFAAISGVPQIDPEGLIRDVQLFEVSLVREPANPHCRILRVDSDEDQEC